MNIATKQMTPIANKPIDYGSSLLKFVNIRYSEYSKTTILIIKWNIFNFICLFTKYFV